MSDTDVEKTLKEIRERVRVQIRRQRSATDLQNLRPNPPKEPGFESLRANLSIIERSWNKLPPLTSYRSGWVARLELSCKRLLKRATHWFTWEQVNFNSATSNSLQEILAALSEHERVLSELRKQLQRIESNPGELRFPPEYRSPSGDNSAEGPTTVHATSTLTSEDIEESDVDKRQLTNSETTTVR